MLKSKIVHVFLAALVVLSFTGCENLPGTKQSQGAVIGGLGGAAAGAAIGGKENRLLGALLGGALGAGGGYVIGANSDKIMGRDHQAATTATQNAQAHPATAQDVRNSNTADLNHDGFVTLDEVTALRSAGLTDAQMLQRLRATDQVFELTSEQEQYLRDHGISTSVIQQMENINRDKREQILNSGNYPTTTTPSTTTHPTSTYPNSGNGVIISQPAPR